MNNIAERTKPLRTYDINYEFNIIDIREEITE